MPAPAPASATAVTSGSGIRLDWADLAKGACILLVVLHHVTTKHYLPLVPAEVAPVAAGWEWLTGALKPVRMPLFFLLAGIFAAGAVRRPWPQVLVPRVLTPYWVYAVWLAVLGVVFGLERTMVTNRVQDPGELLADLVFASTGAWFLYALALYFVLAKTTLRVDVRVVVGLAAVVAISVSALPMTAANRESVVLHFVYFVLGARLPEIGRVLADGRRVPLGVLLLAYAGAAATTAVLGFPLSVEIVALSLLGVPTAVRLAVAAGTSDPLARGVTALGRRTLPVYVLHMPVLAVWHHLPGLTLDVGGATGWVLAALYPVAVAVAVTVVSLGLHRLLLALGLPWLFTLPAWVRLHTPAGVSGTGDAPPRVGTPRRQSGHDLLAPRLGRLPRRAGRVLERAAPVHAHHAPTRRKPPRRPRRGGAGPGAGVRLDHHLADVAQGAQPGGIAGPRRLPGRRSTMVDARG